MPFGDQPVGLSSQSCPPDANSDAARHWLRSSFWMTKVYLFRGRNTQCSFPTERM